MRAANHIETRLLYHSDVAAYTLLGNGVAPSCVVLMDIRALQIKVLTVDEDPLVGCPLDVTETERGGVSVQNLAAVAEGEFKHIKIRRIGRPKFYIVNVFGLDCCHVICVSRNILVG